MKQIRGIWLPDSDTHFEKHLLAGPAHQGKGTYQYEKFLLAMKYCTNFHCAVDVGAHVGLWTRVLSDKFKVIHAFEPVPEHVECFTVNALTGGNAFIHLHNVALGNSNSNDIVINVDKENSGHSRIDPKFPKKQEGSITARMTRLDDYEIADVNFLKIDVEGYEFFVIQGAERTIHNSWPTILVEQKAGHGKDYICTDLAAVDLLQEYGYNLAWMKNGDYCMVPPSKRANRRENKT